MAHAIFEGRNYRTTMEQGSLDPLEDSGEDPRADKRPRVRSSMIFWGQLRDLFFF